MPLEEELLASPVEGPSTWADVFVEPQQSLAALLCSSVIGVAICDRQFRFRAINEALASMNGLPAESHIGKTLQQIMGDASHRIEPAIQHVLATGRPLCNLEVTAKLPTKPEVKCFHRSAIGVEFDNDGILFVHGGETLGGGGFQNP